MSWLNKCARFVLRAKLFQNLEALRSAFSPCLQVKDLCLLDLSIDEPSRPAVIELIEYIPDHSVRAMPMPARAMAAQLLLCVLCRSRAQALRTQSWSSGREQLRSQNATAAEIIIGKVKVKVSRSRISNPAVLGPAPRPFSLLFA